MGWTFTPPASGQQQVAFDFEGTPTAVDAHGDRATWACAVCGAKVAFHFAEGGTGSGEDHPTACPGCGKEYYLSPEWTPGPRDRELAPSNPMTIVARDTPGLIEE